MVFVTHDEEHEINGFFANNPFGHTNNYFEISREMALNIDKFRYSGYLIYNGKTHQAIGAFIGKKTTEERYAHLGYIGLPQLILKATENLKEAKENLKKICQARKILR